jgi:hypothetical protein
MCRGLVFFGRNSILYSLWSWPVFTFKLVTHNRTVIVQNKNKVAWYLQAHPQLVCRVEMDTTKQILEAPPVPSAQRGSTQQQGRQHAQDVA